MTQEAVSTSAMRMSNKHPNPASRPFAPFFGPFASLECTLERSEPTVMAEGDIAMPSINTAEPLTVPLSRAPQIIGISRSGIYRAAAAGHIRLIKCGRTTLVCMKSAREYLDGLPRLTPHRQNCGSRRRSVAAPAPGPPPSPR